MAKKPKMLKNWLRSPTCHEFIIFRKLLRIEPKILRYNFLKAQHAKEMCKKLAKLGKQPRSPKY